MPPDGGTGAEISFGLDGGDMDIHRSLDQDVDPEGRVGLMKLFPIHILTSDWNSRICLIDTIDEDSNKSFTIRDQKINRELANSSLDVYVVAVANDSKKIIPHTWDNHALIIRQKQGC